MTGNKGEWSELYAFFKLLGEGKLYAADEKVKKLEDIYFPILKIIREEYQGEIVEYIVDDSDIRIESDDKLVASLPRETMREKAKYLLEQIKSNNNSFAIEEIEKFASGIKVTKIKAPSSDITDITMKIEDINTGIKNKVGFSIKSELGNPPTLLNASEATNFVYSVTGITDAQMEEINKIDTRKKIVDKMAKIKEYGGQLNFERVNNPGFKRNLIMIDSMMPKLIADFLLYHYQDDVKSCAELVQLLGERDPLEYGEEIIYEYKIKKFLCSCALGMRPAKSWDGIDEANGGYIIVKSDGEVLAYHIYNRNLFEKYLLDNTILERASTGRHKYMELYKEDGKMLLKLNLQIRFSR